MSKPHKLSAKAKIRLQYYKLRLEASKFFGNFKKSKPDAQSSSDSDEEDFAYDDETIDDDESITKKLNTPHQNDEDRGKSSEQRVCKEQKCKFKKQEFLNQGDRDRNLNANYHNSKIPDQLHHDNTRSGLPLSLSSTQAMIRPSSAKTMSSDESISIKKRQQGLSRRKRSSRTKNRRNNKNLGSIDLKIINGDQRDPYSDEKEYCTENSAPDVLHEPDLHEGITEVLEKSLDTTVDTTAPSTADKPIPSDISVPTGPNLAVDPVLSAHSQEEVPHENPVVSVQKSNSSISLHQSAGALALALMVHKNPSLFHKDPHPILKPPPLKPVEEAIPDININKSEEPKTKLSFKEKFQQLLKKKRHPSAYKRVPKEFHFGIKFIYKKSPARYSQIKKAEAEAQMALNNPGSVEDVEFDEDDNPSSFVNTLAQYLPHWLTGSDPPTKNQSKMTTTKEAAKTKKQPANSQKNLATPKLVENSLPKPPIEGPPRIGTTNLTSLPLPVVSGVPTTPKIATTPLTLPTVSNVSTTPNIQHLSIIDSLLHSTPQNYSYDNKLQLPFITSVNNINYNDGWNQHQNFVENYNRSIYGFQTSTSFDSNNNNNSLVEDPTLAPAALADSTKGESKNPPVKVCYEPKTEFTSQFNHLLKTNLQQQ